MIPVSNPALSYRFHKKEINDAIAQVLETGVLINGKNVTAIEDEFSSYLGLPYGIGVASGTDAIEISLRALGIGLGDEVITVSHTSVATVSAIERAGAIPVLVDIEEDYFTLDPQQIKLSITPRTRAVVAVHLYGQACSIFEISNICKEYGLFLIEDACQAHGATFRERKLGSIGEFGCFSFYPTKNLGGMGDGGMIVTNSKSLYDKCMNLREYGWKERYVSETPGVNSRLDEIQAAILRIKLKYLDSENQKRRDNAQYYRQSLFNLNLGLPKERDQSSHVYHLYVVRSKNRGTLQDRLREKKIASLIHYPVPIHWQPAYREKLRSLPLPVTETIASEILSIPMYPHLGSQREDVVRAIIESLDIIG